MKTVALLFMSVMSPTGRSLTKKMFVSMSTRKLEENSSALSAETTFGSLLVSSDTTSQHLLGSSIRCLLNNLLKRYRDRKAATSLEESGMVASAKARVDRRRPLSGNLPLNNIKCYSGKIPSQEMINVGIGDDHGAGCAIEANGTILYAASEERFSGHKNDAGFPLKSLQTGLAYLGKSVKDIENLFIATKEHTDYLSYEYRRDCLLSIKDHQQLMDRYWRPKLEGLSHPRSLPLDLIKKSDHFLENGFYGIPLDSYSKEWTNKNFQDLIIGKISDFLGIDPERIHFVDHHECHVAYAISTITSLPEEFAVITVDSYGDGRNQTVWCGKDNILQNVAESKNCPLARIYRFTTLYLGMKPLEHEYKVMGLSTYANRSYYQHITEKLMSLVEFRGLSITQTETEKNLYDAIAKMYSGERFDNIAGAVQSFTETILEELFTRVNKALNVTDFFYSGGVSMNVKANKKLMELDCVTSLIVPGAPDDVSIPAGACLVQHMNRRREKAPVKNMYLGPSLSQSDINATIERIKLDNTLYHIEEVDNDRVADLLANGEVLARVVGRMEFGARALGNRSILAAPDSWDIVDQINHMIKNRDFWMPFAATVLDIDMDSIFSSNWKKSDPRFMTIALDTNKEFLKMIKAGTHRKDKTMRVHMLRREDNQLYYDLIMALRERSGVGAILNTSFNLHGYPVAWSADEAFRIFKTTSLQHLILEDQLISKM